MNLTIDFPELQSTQICITFFEKTITGSKYCQVKKQSAKQQTSSFAQKIQYAIEQYFQDPSYVLSLPCDLQQGTAFQQKVWKALRLIPSGQVKTYGTLAKELNSSARAVGNACRNNPCPLIIPCHRVVSASGIGGFGGDTMTHQRGEMNFLQIKQWLLAHEKASY